MTLIKRTVISGMLLASCVLLPMAFHAVPGAGPMILPMHIPVLVAGLACGPVFGAAVGVIGPFLSNLLTGMPPTGPILLTMMIELGVYGAVTGLILKFLRLGRSAFDLYAALIGAMLVGRIVAGFLQALFFFDGVYAIGVWTTQYFVTSLPGIVIQLVFLPSLVMALERERVIPARYSLDVKKDAALT